VGIVDRGRLVAEGTPGDLAADLGTDVIRVRGSGNQAHFVSHVTALPFVARIETDPEAAMVLVYVDSGSRRLVEVVGLASGNGFVVEDVTVARPSLGDVFLHHTGRALRD
jgi:ABC-2 type transport system ATP-binding protein